MPTPELCLNSAVELARLIRAREVSSREVTEAHILQIERIDPEINAICTFHPEMALEAADQADRQMARDGPVGVLHGLPTAIKDTEPVRGLRFTEGSPIFSDRVAAEDALVVERIRAAGAVLLGKTNVPEFGAGSHTFNPVFGATRNGYDQTKTAGGSSGGAAAALACRMLPFANGSDMGGSLRNPGNFNNVVGFRCSPGRVPFYPAAMGWFTLGVPGPMARTAADTALLLSAIAGADDRCPIGIPEPAEIFSRPLERDFRGVRVAWSRDLGGLPVDPRVIGALESRLGVFRDLGCVVEEAEPDFSDADEIFRTLRAWSMAQYFAEHLRLNRALVKDTVVRNTEQGFTLTGQDVSRAEVKRTALYHRLREFFKTCEFLLCPVNQVPPFDITTEYPTEVAGVQMEDYIDWMRSAYYVSVTGLPALSVPCAFTEQGLPVGLQIVGRHQRDFDVLQLAHAFEQATLTYRRLPPVITRGG
jgi:amidase